jgi:hypothetical protein
MLTPVHMEAMREWAEDFLADFVHYKDQAGRSRKDLERLKKARPKPTPDQIEHAVWAGFVGGILYEYMAFREKALGWPYHPWPWEHWVEEILCDRSEWHGVKFVREGDRGFRIEDTQHPAIYQGWLASVALETATAEERAAIWPAIGQA